MNKAPEPEILAVAKLGAPRGVDGSLKLHSYSGEYAHLKKLTTALLAPADNHAHTKVMRIKSAQVGDWGMSMVFEGYETPEKAKALTGLEILLPRDLVSPLKSNEYYIHDLVGMKLLLDGRTAGELVAVLDGGADPLLEIKPAAGGANVLVPFRSEFIGTVDCEAKSIELLAGWLLE